MHLTRFRLLITLAFALLAGCGRQPPPTSTLPPTPDLLLRPPPELTPQPGEIPLPGDTYLGGPTFRVTIDAEGRIFRGGNQTTFADVCDELRGLPKLSDTTVMIYSDSDVGVRTVTTLQSKLSQTLPDLGPVVYTVQDNWNGG